MKTFTRFLSLLAVLALLAPSAWAQEVPAKIKDALLNNSAQGREFYIAIPPNEKPDHTYKGIEIYITSSKNTTVKLEAPGLGWSKSKPVEAFKITTFNQDDGIGANFEIRDGEVVVPYAIRITADQALSVYVLNPKPVTSEGYLALPVSVWGKENIHCSFYDFGEVKPWGGGFIVIASQDQTQVTMTLRGVGSGRTVGNKKIGDVIQKTLNKGDVFMVRTNGANLGSFDITGSLIKSTKPVGLISFHERVMIPAIANNNGRDHISEMIPPTSAWGKKFVSAEYKRLDKGDLFRAVAKEDGTTVSVVWYDKVTNSIIGKNKWVLRAGQFAQSLYATTSPGGEDIRGYSVWEADKPILLMQYSYSANWDGKPEFDPFMIIVPPLEQYIQGTVFQTPANVAFNTNWFNILAIGDSTDKNYTLLKTLKLDGQYLYQTDPKILLQRIPGTNVYYLAKNVAPGAHRMESNTKFAGFIYGFSDFDSYGWPAAMAINKIDELDTLEPELQISQDCGVFSVTATEVRDGKINDNPRQIESGVSDVAIVTGESFNYKPEPDPATFANDPMVRKHEFKLEVLDKTKDARIVFDVVDRAGNVARDTVEYIADKLAINPDPVDFLKVRVTTSKDMDIMLKNNGTIPVEVKKVSMAIGSVFQVVDPLAGFTLGAGEEKPIKVRYSPTEEYPTTPLQYDLDSLIVETTCARFPWPVVGRGVMPKIQVGDFNAGARPINNKYCLDDGLPITNIGTEDLIVNANPTGYTAPFTFTNIDPILPVTIEPGKTIFLKQICFESPVINEYTQDILFSSNAMAGDSISNWRGRTTNAELFITDKNWYERRVGTQHDSIVELTNQGNTEITLTDLYLQTSPDNNLSISGNATPYHPNPGSPVRLQPVGADDPAKITVPVRFEPQAEGPFINNVVVAYTKDGKPDQILGKIQGIGVIPKIAADPVDFCKVATVEVGKSSAPLPFQFTNTGTMKMTVTKIVLKDPGNVFEWADQPGSDIRTLATPIVLAPGELSPVYQVVFTPAAVGTTTASIEVDADTQKGTDAPETHPYEVKGCAFAPGLEYTNIDATNLLCDNPIGTLTITNTGGSPVNITAVPQIQDDPNFPGESAFFTIANPAAFPAVIQPGAAPLDIQVQFTPNTERTYHALVVAQTDNGPVTMSIVWKTTRVNAKFTLTNDSKLKLADKFNVTINGESGTWNQVGAKSFTAQLIYNPKEMSYTGSITKSNLIQNWGNPQVSAPVDLTDGRQAITITASGPDAIAANGPLVTLGMETYLTPRQTYAMALEMSLDSRDKCVIIDTVGSTIFLEDCFIEGRAVDVGANQFMLMSVNPNPATGGVIELKYSVGFTAHTRIELYNSMGELVKTVVDGVQEAGEHTVTVRTEKLSSGVYHYRMISGPFQSNKSMLIAE